jgi:hypothetical protein
VPPEARRNHMALLGGTGTARSTLLANMGASDLPSATGSTVLDPMTALTTSSSRTIPPGLSPETLRRIAGRLEPGPGNALKAIYNDPYYLKRGDPIPK